MALSRRTLLAGGAGAAIAAAALGWMVLRPAPPNPVPVSIAVFDGITSAMVRAAHEDGHMARRGLDATLTPYATGYDAMQAMLRGEADMATATDWVVVRAALDDPDIRIVAEVSGFALNQIVARRDRGVETVQDLRGATIAYNFGTVQDLLLPRFLEAQGLGDGSVTLVNIPSPELGDALLNGEVDAIVAWGKYAFPTLELLGDDAVSFPVESRLSSRFVLATRASFIAAAPEAVTRAVGALVDTQAMLDADFESFRQATKERYGMCDALAACMFPNVLFNVGLGQALVAVLEDRGRFAQSRGLVANREEPNGLTMIDTAPLRAVGPQYVTIVE
jgi:ABC-type nitrate/sulfonate/bicarbonate transport system substrate-binding protein